MEIITNTYNQGWKKEFTIDDDFDVAVLFFGNDDTAFSVIKDKYKKAHIVGCTTSGEIDGNTFHEGSMCTVLKMHKTRLKTVVIKDINYENSFDYGKRAMTQLIEEESFLSEKLNGVLLFTDGLNVNGAKVAEGIASINSIVKVAGGTAADNLAFERTHVFSHEKIGGALVALGFYGEDIVFELGSKSGVEPIGIEKKITHAENNVLYSLDGEPALDVYKKWFKNFSTDNELRASLLECPVEISSNFQKEEGLVRTPIDLNEKDGSIRYTGEIPQGKSLRMMRADIEGMVSASEEIVEETWGKISKKDQNDNSILSLLVSCSGRKAVLKTEVEDEFFNANKNIKNKNSAQVGLYSYGEYNRVNEEKGVEFLNQTMTVVCIYEKQ